MFNGYMYNVVNPLYGEDIGTAQIKRMYPTSIDPITGMPELYMNGVTMNAGQPLVDSFETPKQQREKAVIKTILAGLVLAGLGFLGIKKGSAITKSLLSKVTSPFKSVWTKLKGLFKHTP